MSRTYRKEYTRNLLHNGERGHHNTLLREFKGVEGIWMVKSGRNLLDRRDYESDRQKLARLIMSKKRRVHLKHQATEIINNQLEEIL